MRAETLALLLGCWLVQCLLTLPPVWGLCLVAAGLLYPAWRARRWRRFWRCGLIALAGAMWSVWQAQAYLHQRLPSALEGTDLVIEGRVASLPAITPERLRFDVDVERVMEGGETWPLPARIRLSWYRTQERPRLGERWRFSVRLKRPAGFANPGGFDYEGWLYQQGIHATGSVRKGANARLTAPPPGAWLDRWRSRLAAGLHDALPDTRARAILIALVIGAQHDIDSIAWDRFARTGTGHLISISGLHVSLVAGLVMLVVRRVWTSCPRVCLWVPAPQAAAWLGFAAAVVYAALAGFSIPTQRALIMIGVVAGASVARRALAPLHALCIALWLVLLHDSRAVLSIGFWLSFFAVAVIAYALYGRLRAGRVVWRHGRLPVVMAVAMLPITLLFFQRASLIAPLANLVAVPWVSVLVVPAALLGSLLLDVLPGIARPVLMLAHAALEWLWPLLDGLAGLPFAQWQAAAPGAAALVAALLACVVLLAPRGMPGRAAGMVLLLPLVFPRLSGPVPGQFDFTLLDVGQGLAAVVRTAGHVLVFDTGPRLGERLDAGRAVIAPYLRDLGIGQVDLLVVSHGDLDHRGGVAGLAAELRIANALASVPDELPMLRAARCQAGESWAWDGVDFEMLAPGPDAARSKNDRSCVLRVSGASGRVLLSGDIEAAGERALLASAADLRADVLVAPHHGSRSSSSPAFIAAVDPTLVLFPVGYRNRYGFPRPEIVARYAAHGAAMFDTAGSGAISVRLHGPAFRPSIQRARDQRRRYWMRD